MAQYTGQIVALLVLMSAFPVFADVSVTRQKELRNMIEHDCGSCHGLTRKGGLGPALTTEILQERPYAVLFNAIRDGIDGTPMPPWNGILSDEEILWILHQLREGT